MLHGCQLRRILWEVLYSRANVELHDLMGVSGVGEWVLCEKERMVRWLRLMYARSKPSWHQAIVLLQ